METIRNFCNPNRDWYGIEDVEMKVKEAHYQINKGTAWGFCLFAAEIFVMEFGISGLVFVNIIVMLGKTFTACYREGFDEGKKVFVKGVRAEGYFLAIAVSLPFFAIYAGFVSHDVLFH